MQINSINNSYQNNYPNRFLQCKNNNTSSNITNPNFSANFKKLANINIAEAPVGFIGHTKVQNSEGKEIVAELHKDSMHPPIFRLDADNQKIGHVELGLISDCFSNSPTPYTKVEWIHSPHTKYKNSSPQAYKGVGTRLIQVAQKYSCDAGYDGKLKINMPVEKAMKFYTEKLPFVHEPTDFYPQLVLPTNAYDKLKQIDGGL